MRKKIYTILIMLVLMLSVFVFPKIFVERCKATERYVKGPDPHNYSSIQAAINDANNGDTIIVYDGTYYENVVVNKSITLQSKDGRDTTIIDGGGSGDVVYITANCVNISGFTIQNSQTNHTGIYVHSNFVNISDSIIKDTDYGIYFNGSSNSSTLSSSTITNNSVGIYVYNSSNVTINLNNVANNEKYGFFINLSSKNNINNNSIGSNTNISSSGLGLYLYHSSNNSIVENNFFNNSIFINGDELYQYIHTIENNTVNGKPLYYYKNNVGLNISDDAGAVILINCSNSKVTDVDISYVDIGIQTYYSENLTISNCSITYNDYGIYSNFTANSTIYNNIINNNYFALIVSYSNYVRINSNNFSNDLSGMLIIYSNLSSIEYNNITNNFWGILVAGCENGTIRCNNFNSNVFFGLFINDSNNNIIYHNNFLNGLFNFSLQSFDDCNNTWYSPILQEGNFYEDYNGEDNNGDGIGDTPYNISGGDNQDLYPLLDRFENYSILSITATSQVNEGAEFTVTVKTKGGTLIESANVTFNGIMESSASNGQVTFTAPSVSLNTVYSITATKNGYAGASSTITVKNADTGGPGPGPGGPSGPGGGGDTTPPTAPTNVRCTTPVTDNTPSFRWNASIDENGIAGYYIKIDGGKDIWIGNVLTWTSASVIADGTHTFYVKAKDNSTNKNNGTYVSCSFIINTTTVGNHPLANAGGPYTGLTFQKITFDGSGSYDTDGTIINYTWNFGDGTTGYGIRPTHIYNKSALFNIILTVKDNDGLTNSSKTTVAIILDSDGDGLSDEVEVTLGSDPTNKSDVLTIDIDGTAYYLVDTNRDGKIDAFCNSNTKKSTTLGFENGKYLIDINGDSKWERTYDPASKEVTQYAEITSKVSNEFPWLLVIIGTVIAIVVIIAILFLTGVIRIEREYIEEKSSEEQKSKKQKSQEQQPEEKQSIDDSKN